MQLAWGNSTTIVEAADGDPLLALGLALDALSSAHERDVWESVPIAGTSSNRNLRRGTPARLRWTWRRSSAMVCARRLRSRDGT